MSEYPRPAMRRESYLCLNGSWEYAIQSGAFAQGRGILDVSAPAEYEGQILVPFSPEAKLSGVERSVGPADVLWYRRRLHLPAPDEGQCVLLNFEAVDWECACRVNGVLVGTHRGGYEPFSFDITQALAARDATCEVEVCVHDPSDEGAQPRGKQRLVEGKIWYKAQSGIWQTVWAEYVPCRRIISMEAVGDVEASCVVVRLCTTHAGDVATIEVSRDGALVAEHREVLTSTSATLRVPIASPCLWSPDDPCLYELRLSYADDEVSSYCAFRTTEIRRGEAGGTAFCLNGDPLLLEGVLVQGYWPDGLMTAPSDEALVSDILAARRLGFNTLRMHVKLERRRFYYHCDRLGMLVMQDLVSGGRHIRLKVTGGFAARCAPLRHWLDDRTPLARNISGVGSRAERTEWLREATGAVELLRRHPSIVAWTLFNEGWGQYSARRLTKVLGELDPTRPIDATSGWFDQRSGDFYSVHDYTADLETLTKALAENPTGHLVRGRALLLSECGGLSYLVPGHGKSEEAWGYVQFAEQGAYADALRELVRRLRACGRQGLVGYVYTQLYDVETECNGLLTYDRAVDKTQGLGTTMDGR